MKTLGDGLIHNVSRSDSDVTALDTHSLLKQNKSLVCMPVRKLGFRYTACLRNGWNCLLIYNSVRKCKTQSHVLTDP
jgi:hypothetical protein